MNYKDRLNKRAVGIPPSGIRKFFDIVSEMPDAISLGVGEPDFVTPWEIRDAAIKSLQKGYTSYTSNKGLGELRERIAQYLKNRFNLLYTANETIVTIGASEAIDLGLRAVINEGDEVLVPDPSYVSYQPNVAICGGVAKPIKLTADNSFVLTAKALQDAITPKTKMLILPYPNNPTGAVMTKEQLLELVPVIKKHDLFVLSDEIYAELTYNGTHTSIASLDGMRERTIMVSGFSKAFAMTGWRVGYVCAPREIIDVMLKIHQYVIMCAPTVSQYAALAALKTGEENSFASVSDMREKYDMRRRFLVSAFNDMGLSCFTPYGAFYAFPSVKSTGLNGEEFAETLLKKKSVAVVPGSAFGESGFYHVRCSYATSMAQLKIAVQRIAEMVSELKTN